MKKRASDPSGVILLSLARGKEAGSRGRGRENGMGNERLIEDEHRFVRTARRRGRRVDADTGNRGRDVFFVSRRRRRRRRFRRRRERGGDEDADRVRV